MRLTLNRTNSLNAPSMKPIHFDLELTDTFGGEANYSWVIREKLVTHQRYSDAWIVRQAKAVVGMTGVRSRTTNYGDSLRIDFVGACQVLFVTFKG